MTDKAKGAVVSVDVVVGLLVEKEIEQIKNCPHWVTAWWTPEYYRNRIDELNKDVSSKNKDLICIQKRLGVLRGQTNETRIT